MIKMKDIAWLGGILEGEGCFRLHTGKYPMISIGMTAEDTIIKVADMWGTRIYRHRNMWETQITGAYAIQWMLTLYLFLNKNRRGIIVEAVKFWRKYSCARASNGIPAMAKCHPDKKLYALGLCSFCYGRKRREEKQLLKVM